jgi:hypothetical protein
MAKSDNKQWIFLEVPTDQDLLALNPQPEPEDQQVLELRDQLLQIVHNAIKTVLTPHQQQLVNLYYLQGRTQREIADILSCHQTSVTLSLHGIWCYDFSPPRRHGGALPKLRKYLLSLPEVNQILESINGQR